MKFDYANKDAQQIKQDAYWKISSLLSKYSLEIDDFINPLNLVICLKGKERKEYCEHQSTRLTITYYRYSNTEYDENTELVQKFLEVDGINATREEQDEFIKNAYNLLIDEDYLNILLSIMKDCNTKLKILSKNLAEQFLNEQKKQWDVDPNKVDVE